MNERRARLHVLLLAMAVMILEVALTRVFSFTTYHHMTYLVIAVAMLGFGAAGTFLTLQPSPSDASEATERLARHAALFGIATAGALGAMPWIRFYPMDMYHLGDPRNLISLALLVVVATAPFFFGGTCIALLLSSAGAAVNRIYFADLAGSAIGALAAILLVNSVGAVATCLLAAALAAGTAALASGRRRLPYAGLALGLLLLSPLSENPSVFPLRVPPGKQMHGSEATIETTRWHVITRLDVGRPMICACSFGGSLSRKYTGSPEARLIFQDGSNLTGIIHPTPTPRETPVFGYFLQGAPYVVRPGALGLVIGSGGGVDVMVALHHGARHVVAVDVNPATMDLVRNQYGDFSGHVFDRPDVEPVVSEGRHFLSRDARKFDVIQLSGVDTWAAQASGAYALTENFVYTAEAFDRYLAHLSPEGLLGFSRPFVEPPLETFRLVATAMAALERAGADNPASHLFIVQGHGLAADVPWAELLVKRSPFSQPETLALTEWATERGFEVAFDPFLPRATTLDGLARASQSRRGRMLASYALDVRPVTDDAPFYFQYHRWRDLLSAPLGVAPPMAMWILAGSCVQVLFLSALVILLPLARRSSGAAARGGRAALFTYFASLGLGFIFIEVALLQKLSVFLGGPAYAMAITLFTLLSASGLGSYLSQRRATDPLPFIHRLTPAIAALTVATALAVELVVPLAEGLPLPGRAAVAVLMVGPLGLLLGMPFPAGLRHLDAHRPELKPWAWGINACATVVGTTTCMVVVSSYGFRAALFVGAAVYLVGGLVLRLGPRGAAAPAAAAAA